MIRTVLGDVENVEGAILIHEHLQIDLTRQKGPEVILGSSEEDDIVGDLQVAKTHGLRAVADLSVPGSGRDPVALRRISERSGLPVICATGFYWDPFPAIVAESSEDKLRDLMVREIEAGVGDTGIRCGLIKVGTEPGRPSATAERLFRAAALASRETGAALITHTSSPDQISWHVRVLASCGADFSRVLISHFGTTTVNRMIEVGARGAFMGIDQIGFQKGPTYEQLADLVRDACAAGLDGQVVLSSDVARRGRLQRHGGTSYSTVFTHFLPLLRERGITDAQIANMMGNNQRALLHLEKSQASRDHRADEQLLPQH
jgi:phosphotriesterase-related protein